MEKNLGKCQRFQEIKPTPTPSKEEGRLNLYQGLRAIHSTFGRVKVKNIQLFSGEDRATCLGKDISHLLTTLSRCHLVILSK